MRRWLSVISYPRDYAIFLLAYRHGLRASEMGLISVDDIDLKQQRIRLQRLKGSLTSTQPMKPDEIKAIKRALKARLIEPVRERFP
jgi:integrase